MPSEGYFYGQKNKFSQMNQKAYFVGAAVTVFTQDSSHF